MAYGILVPWPGIKPALSAVEMQSHFNHWAAREVPAEVLNVKYFLLYPLNVKVPIWPLPSYIKLVKPLITVL